MMAPDAVLSSWLTGLVGKVPAFDRLMSLFVSDFFLPLCAYMILIALWCGTRNPLRRERNQRAVLCAATGAGFSCLAVWILYHAVHLNLWPRPFVALASAQYAASHLFYFPTDPSFPSNGAAVLFALAFGMWLTNRKAGWVLFSIALLWSFARVYCGVHYPLDIVGGAAIGFIVTYVIAKAFWPAIEPLLALIFRVMKRLYLA
jgi:undecaprenyl-diphosphatase